MEFIDRISVTSFDIEKTEFPGIVSEQITVTFAPVSNT